MKQIIYIAILFLLPLQLQAQKTLTLTLSEAIEMHVGILLKRLRPSRFQGFLLELGVSFRAKQLPSLTLTSGSELEPFHPSQSALEDGSDKFVHRNQLSVDASLEIQQNIALTGGRFY